MKHWMDFVYGYILVGASVILGALLIIWYAQLMMLYEFEGYVVVPIVFGIGGLLNMGWRWFK